MAVAIHHVPQVHNYPGHLIRCFRFVKKVSCNVKFKFDQTSVTSIRGKKPILLTLLRFFIHLLHSLLHDKNLIIIYCVMEPIPVTNTSRPRLLDRSSYCDSVAHVQIFQVNTSYTPTEIKLNYIYLQTLILFINNKVIKMIYYLRNLEIHKSKVNNKLRGPNQN